MGWTKEDKSFKKLIDKRGTSADFKFYEEFGDTTLDIQFGDVKTDPIPFNDPTSAVNDAVAVAYTLGSEFILIEDTDASANSNTWYTGITAVGGPGNGTYSPGSNYDQVLDWISDKNGLLYPIRLFENNGSEIFLTDPSNWIFDYPTGILTFGLGDDDNSLDGGFNNSWSTPLKITGYNYVGAFGQGGGGGAASFEIPVTQTGLGLLVSVDDMIALPDNGIYALANATSINAVAVGIVTKIIDDDNIEYQDIGVTNYLTGGLIKGYTYFLDTVDGAATHIRPNNFVQSVFVAIETDEILININPMFEFEIVVGLDASVLNHFADCDALIADQSNQLFAAIYYVEDPTTGAITDSNITIGYAYYEYLGTTVGDMTDYRIIGTEQSINPIQTVVNGWALSDEVTDLIENPALDTPTVTDYASFNANITEIMFNVNTPSDGEDLEFDVHINGVSIFSTLPTIDQLENTTLTAAIPQIITGGSVNINKGDKIEIFIKQIGTVVKGAGAKAKFIGTEI